MVDMAPPVVKRSAAGRHRASPHRVRHSTPVAVARREDGGSRRAILENMTGASNRRPDTQRFLCDAMLGSLARWLRFFGFDAVFHDPGLEDSILAAEARAEGRWLLTRDRALAAVGPRTVLVRSELLEDQLVEVFARLGVRPRPTLDRARCGECNGDLEQASRDEVARDVPPHVLATATRFRRCSECGRVYWPGSHGSRIVERMQAVVDRLEG